MCVEDEVLTFWCGSFIQSESLGVQLLSCCYSVKNLVRQNLSRSGRVNVGQQSTKRRERGRSDAGRVLMLQNAGLGQRVHREG